MSQPPDAVRASSIAEPQPSQAGSAYGAPLLQVSGEGGYDASARVSGEAYFPVSAPHRLRSKYLLRNVSGDDGGDRIPQPTGTPTLSRGNTPLDVSGEAALANPLLRPTAAEYADPSGTATTASEGFSPAVRMSFEQPDVHLDQDWTIAFEGVLPGLDGVRGELATTDGFQTLRLSARETNFCSFGVEDRALASDRISAFNAALQNEANLPPDEGLASRVADYVQITDELLPIQDPYWALDENDCWAPFDEAADINESNPAARGAARYRSCFEAFGKAEEGRVSRDFPILEASRGELTLGRYYYPEGSDNDVRGREIIGAQSSNRGVLAAAMCCFHNRVSLRVRSGGAWLASGSVTGHLHHVVADDSGRCVQSCEPHRRLQNARTFSAPRELQDQNFEPKRNSALAMRNPMMSFYIVDGRDEAGRVRPDRDFTWRFATRNQFTSMALDTASRSTQTNPRALRFIAPLGQVAVLDGASQGLSMIDLRTMTFLGDPVY